MIGKRLNLMLFALISSASLAASGVGAQTDVAPPKNNASKATAKPNKPQAQSGLALTIVNQRAVDLSELDIARAGSPAFKTIVRKLGRGQKAVVKFQNGEDCVFDVHLRYDDGALNDLTNIDLCKDGKINLVD
jgi:hypothetical protein